MTFREDENPRLVATGMMILGMLYSTNDQEKIDTIARVIANMCDEELLAAFEHTESKEEAAKTLEGLKDAYRTALQDAIDAEWGGNKEEIVKQQAAVKPFMGDDDER